MEENLEKNNYGYIDGANLYGALKKLEWDFDYGRFRIWLKEKYKVEIAYIFLGLVPKYSELYTHLQGLGFTIIFKEVTYGKNGKIKGNCDADMVVKVMRDSYENNFSKAIVVSSDGDFGSLVSFLIEKEKIETILSPSVAKKCSILLKKTGAKISYINDQKSILEKEKAPDGDKTP